MVVACRTQQLLKTGKNVTISKKFNYATGATPFSFKKCTEKNSVPHSDFPRVRLFDFKRFHSSRETRTTPAKLTPQEFCISQSRTDSLLDNQNIRNSILDAILQNQGTSASQIEDVIDAADGNITEAVAGVNSELKENVLKIEGNVVRVDAEAVRNLVRNKVQNSIRDRLSDNPSLAETIQNSIEQQIQLNSIEFDNSVGEYDLPIDVAEQYLSFSRRKRSLVKREAANDGGLGQVVTDILLQIVRDQLGNAIVGLLDNVKNILNTFIVEVAPGNPVGDVLAGLQNSVIKSLLQVITVIEENIRTPQPPSNSTQSRRKRDTAVTGQPESSPNSGLLDPIVRPIISLLATILTPVNALVKGLVNALLSLLQIVLGSALVTPVRNLINAVINLLLPTNLP